MVTLQPLTCSLISGNVILQHLCVFRLSAPPTCPLPSKAVLYTNRGLTLCTWSLALLWGFLHLPPAQLAGTWPTVPWDRCKHHCVGRLHPSGCFTFFAPKLEVAGPDSLIRGGHTQGVGMGTVCSPWESSEHPPWWG